MIYTLEMDFTLLNKRNKFAVMLALIKYAAKPIRWNIIYIALSISTHKAKSMCTNINKI